MSEATRAARTEALARRAAMIEAIEAKIDRLQAQIDELPWPTELDEDREWRIEQMTPYERLLHDIMHKGLSPFSRNYLAEQLAKNYDLGPQAKIGTSLRIRLPNDYVAKKAD
jgi:hypothetical protein